jgi:hypothetical protein
MICSKMLNAAEMQGFKFLLGILTCLLPVMARAQENGIAAATSQQTTTRPSEIDAYNYVIGTETFGPTYQFTDEQPLLETARAIQAMGSTVIKFGLHRGFGGFDSKTQKMGNVHQANPNVHTLTELVRDEPTHHQVLDMPFSNFILWTHSFANDADWRSGFSDSQAKAEYKEIYDLTRYLLTNYNGTGKTFYLGHWEGDGWLRKNIKPENDVMVTPQRVQAMADWLNTRQHDAKRDTPHQNVQVWHYTEVNHVKLAMDGRPALVNTVLPKTHVDFVSYSSYDTASDPVLLKKALDFIESKLPPKAGFTGKRVFIGEFGFPAIRYGPDQQEVKSCAVLKAALEWHCPFALYWEMYNNEIDKRGQLGFWMINDKNEKQPIYYTYQRFYQRARQYVAEFRQSHGRLPTADEYDEEAVKFLD